MIDLAVIARMIELYGIDCQVIRTKAERLSILAETIDNELGLTIK